MKKISTAHDADVYRIILDSPPLNVIDIEMMDALLAELDTIRNDRHLLIIDAAGDRMFSAGVSVQEHQGDLIHTMIQRFHSVIRRIDAMEMPTVALVRHRALGGGCELAMACDFVLASESTRFALPEIRLGVFPPVAAWQMQRQLPQRRGLEMMLTGDDINAFEARDLGMINAVFDETDFERKAKEWIDRLLAQSASSLRHAKRAWKLAGAARTMAEAVDAVERVYLDELVGTSDAAEGLAAFLEKRKPVWSHR